MLSEKSNYKCRKFFHDYLWIVLFILSILLISLECYYSCCIISSISASVLLNISCSIFAASVFNFVLIYIPHKMRKKTLEKLIIKDFLRLHECARLCKLSIVSPYKADETKWDNKEEYANQFCKTDLYEKWSDFSGCSYNKLERIEKLCVNMKDIIDHLMFYQDFLSYNQFATLIKILECPIMCSKIKPIDFNIPEQYRCNKYDNQKEIGESIYDLYNILIMCNK